MEKQDFLFVAECQTCYLDDSVKTLQLVVNELTRGLMAWKKEKSDYPIDWAIEHCSGFFVLLRDLERIHDNLEAAVNQEYQEKWRK